MDVVLLQPYLDGMGGAERVVLEIAKKFNSKIYTMFYDPKKTYEEFGEFEIAKIPAFPLEFATRPLKWLDRDKRMQLVASAGLSILNTKINDDYDVISAHLSPSEWIRYRNERVCWYCHGPNAAFELYDIMMLERTYSEKVVLKAGSAAYKAIEIPATNKIEKICTCSEFTEEKIRKAISRKDAEVIYPGVDASEFTCDGYGKFFFYPSRIVPEKRIEFAIEAFKKFNKNKRWKMVVAGNLFDVARNKIYYKHLQEISKSQNISFVIDPDNKTMKRMYSRCFATLFSSLDEDWGIVILEAMASSKPVISIKKGGPTISIVDGKTGFLVNSVDEMAQKMKFLADHPEICEQMGKEGRKRVEKNYTWKIFLDKMEKAFKETAKM